ncbi:MAG: hypothetical protein ACK4NR_12080 [Micavibrio sp.]
MKIEKIENKNESVIPCAEKYRTALEALKDEMSLKQHRLLIGHARSLEQTASLQELMDAALCETIEEVEREYALLGRALAAYLEFIPPQGDLPERLNPIMSIATPISIIGGSFREWKLRPEIAQALHKAKL